jgi:hypothetical protein
MLISQMEGKLDSWAIRWCYHHFKNKAFCIYPTESYVNNIGLDGSGVHCGVNYKYQNKNLSKTFGLKTPSKIELNEKIVNNFKNIFYKNFAKKIFYKIKKIIKTKL